MSKQEKPENKLPEHLLEHATETHIHNPDEYRTSLEKWLRHMVEGGPAAWGPWVGGILVLVLGFAFFSQGGGSSKPGEEAWTEILTARSAAEMNTIADTANTGSGAAWASQMTGNQYYNQALSSLMTSREEALANLNKAQAAFDAAIKRAAGVNDTELVNLSRLGLGRTYEMQGNLTKAIEAYEQVAKEAADSSTGKKAAKYAELLKKPEAQSFYQALATYKPQPPTETGLGSGLGLPPDHPSLDGPTQKTTKPALPDPGDLLRDLAAPPALPGSAPSPTLAPPAGNDVKDLAPPPASPKASESKPAAQPEAKPADTAKPAEPAKPAAPAADKPK
ncbi:MAG: hypothetical protein ACKO5E_14630 [bacterium]